MITALLVTALAEPIVGVAWHPLSRADLVAVSEDRTSGVGVGEFDGTVRPSFQLFGGAWSRGRVGVVGSLGTARLSTTTFLGETVQGRSWTVIRPSVELRVRLLARERRGPKPWAFASTYVDAPIVTDTSNAYSEEEQDAADTRIREETARLGGVGGQLGLGAEIDVTDELSVGLQWGVGVHRGVLRDTAAVSVSTWLATDGALLVTLHWPKRTIEAGGSSSEGS